jgi:hypothetical protein
MNDSQSTGNPSPERARDRTPKATSDGTAASEPVEPKELTPEEQMALYEEDLKETDWGHQPC